ncbi:MAG: UvrB/UvrC motif-containing protein [Phycisphaerae bacterium]|jgi:protein arginine kinase activator|nr:UvrB/UvrC motif-containing protein [Phycisphaerae bacterium]
MKFKCDKCSKPATIHLTEIIDGEKIEKHLCQDCAATEGITVKAEVPISQLLEDFILQTGIEATADAAEATCEVCGMKFSEFRNAGLLGCPNDYDAFEKGLLPLVERAQEGATQHIGKVPHNADDAQKRQTAMLRLQAELKGAITAENYERAAVLRDQIKELENA